jgi:hypothetical protein
METFDTHFLINFIYELNEIFGYTQSIIQQHYKKFIDYYKKGLKGEFVKYNITEADSLDKSIEMYYRFINIIDIDFDKSSNINNNNYTKNIRNISNDDINNVNRNKNIQKWDILQNVKVGSKMYNRFKLFFKIKNINLDNEMISITFLKKLKYFTRLLVNETQYKIPNTLKLQLSIKSKLKKDIEKIILNYQELWRDIIIQQVRQFNNTNDIMIKKSKKLYILHYPILLIESVCKYYIERSSKLQLTSQMKDFLYEKPKINLRPSIPKPVL